MAFYKMDDSNTYTSWVRIEYEAERLITELEEHTTRIVIKDGDPQAENIIFFDTSNFSE